MSRIIHVNRALASAIAISAALWLTGCGGSSKATSQTSSHTSATSVTQSTSTHSGNSSPPAQSSGSSSAQSTTTATSSASASRVANARAHALKMYANCLRRHYINPKASVETPQEKPIVSACLASVEAYFKAATR